MDEFQIESKIRGQPLPKLRISNRCRKHRGDEMAPGQPRKADEVG
jgi:hypothetical protein